MNILFHVVGMLSVSALALASATDLFGRKVKLSKHIVSLPRTSIFDEPTVELTEAITNWQLMNKRANK